MAIAIQLLEDEDGEAMLEDIKMHAIYKHENIVKYLGAQMCLQE